MEAEYSNETRGTNSAEIRNRQTCPREASNRAQPAAVLRCVLFPTINEKPTRIKDLICRLLFQG